MFVPNNLRNTYIHQCVCNRVIVITIMALIKDTGRYTEALKTVLTNAPLGTSDQQVKVKYRTKIYRMSQGGGRTLILNILKTVASKGRGRTTVASLLMRIH